MVLSRQVYISDGTTKQYPIAFADGYLSRDEVNVYEEYDDGTPDKDIPFIFINDNLIQLTTVPKSGTRIVIERDVEVTARKVVFIPQYIKSSDLNTMYQHLLYLIQALMDGRLESTIKSDLDMGYNKIINLGAPTNDNDAVRLVDIKTYTDLAKSLNQQNAAHEAAAKVSETNAKASADAAKASQTAAAASAKSAANTVNGFDAHAADKQTAFDNNYTSKLNSFNTNAANKQAQVDASAETARKWAIGTIREQPNGSAKYWAEHAKTVTDGTLTESILTNCLTEIPQDIKLELSNGTLTLKAGSKVYVPNGVGVFNPVTINGDITLTQKWGTPNDKLLIFYKPVNNSLERISVYSCHSGTTDSGSGGTSHIFYDTTINKINWIEKSGSVDAQLSIPIALVTAVGDNTSSTASIDQVFNGFGYIDSTIFALPGVKGLIPDGLNTDGSLNSTKFTTTSVLTYSYINANSGVLIGINANSLASDKYVYNKDENYSRNPQGVIASRAMFAKVSTDSTGRITLFNPNTAFHAVDYSEYAREVDRCAKIDEDNTFTGVNKFNKAITASRVAYTESNYVNGFSDILLTYDSNKNWWAQLRAQNTSTAFGFMGIYVNEDTGKVETSAPSPHISDNSRQIATTAWVNNKFKKVSTLPAQPDPNVTYLIPEE